MTSFTSVSHLNLKKFVNNESVLKAHVAILLSNI